MITVDLFHLKPCDVVIQSLLWVNNPIVPDGVQFISRSLQPHWEGLLARHLDPRYEFDLTH